MTQSLRVRRMARNHKRMAGPAKLNLVALMDIFTILVLFLIVNNGDVEVLEADKAIALPESVSEQRPQAALIVKVTAHEIYAQEQLIASVEDALDSDSEILHSLSTALQRFAASEQIGEGDQNGHQVIIMGDRGTPYDLLKRIMATCAANDFRAVSLAVNSAPVAPAVEGMPIAATGIAL